MKVKATITEVKEQFVDIDSADVVTKAFQEWKVSVRVHGYSKISSEGYWYSHCEPHLSLGFEAKGRIATEEEKSIYDSFSKVLEVIGGMK